MLPETTALDVRSEKLKYLPNSRGVPVFAVIGEYNRGLYGINRNISFKKQHQLEQLIGVIPLEILKKEIPKVYESIKKVFDSRMDNKTYAF
ncbi:hypothetical protein J4456_00970 [Candidatus Pacearchaeota archaeon]|nr:hypothetical protein [Candidatus Pacearchaeota archaeon]